MLFKNWWMIAFALLCGVLYEQGMKSKSRQFIQLQEQYNDLQQEKIDALAENQLLHRQINSQSDPAWVELVLMKRLGVVPEDTKKFYFE